jgi:hypothetical protein
VVLDATIVELDGGSSAGGDQAIVRLQFTGAPADDEEDDERTGMPIPISRLQAKTLGRHLYEHVLVVIVPEAQAAPGPAEG